MKNRYAWGVVLLLVAATLAAFSPVVQNGFVSLDDPGYIENRHVRAGLSWDGLVWAFTKSHSSNWHPLTWISHMLDVELFGMNAGAHHFESVVLHALSAAVLFLFLRAATGALWTSAFVAGFFALHPLRVESVAWASERKDVLSGLFFFLTLLAYEKYARAAGAWRYTLVLLLATLGLLAKPMLVTLPAVLLLVDLWPLRRWRWNSPDGVALSRLLLEKVPLLLLALGSCIATVWAQGAGKAIKDFDALMLGARVANALESAWLYLAKTLWPIDLAVFYPHPALVSVEPYEPWSFSAIAAGALLVCATVAAFLCVRRKAWITVGWLWYLGMLVPVIGILQVGGQRLADRYTYLPVIGISCAILFELAPRLREKRLRLAGGFLGLAILGVLATLTWRQTHVWRNTETLFLHTLSVTERNYLAHNNLAVEYMERGRLEEAIEHLQARLAISPATGAYINLGTIYARRGQGDRAIETFEIALARRTNQPDALANLGALYHAKGDEQRARTFLRRALETKPPPTLACERMAWILVTSSAPEGRDPARAARLMEMSRQRAGGVADASFQRTLAAVLAANGDFEGAKQAIRKAIQSAPPAARAELAKERELYRAGSTL